MAMVEWIVTMNEGIQVLNDYPKDISLVRYEDLTSETLKTMYKIIDFCELPVDNTMLEYAINILKPTKPHTHIDFHPAILPLFEETMKCFGYNH